jgi:hypothetical protein
VWCSCLASISIELMVWAVEYTSAPLTPFTHPRPHKRVHPFHKETRKQEGICSICDIHSVYVSVTRHVHIGSAGTPGEAEVYEEGGGVSELVPVCLRDSYYVSCVCRCLRRSLGSWVPVHVLCVPAGHGCVCGYFGPVGAPQAPVSVEWGMLIGSARLMGVCAVCVRYE